MGTHPIFESDFDCLTEKLGFVQNDQEATKQRTQQEGPRTCPLCPLRELSGARPQGQGRQEVHGPQHGRFRFHARSLRGFRLRELRCAQDLLEAVLLHLGGHPSPSRPQPIARRPEDSHTATTFRPRPGAAEAWPGWRLQISALFVSTPLTVCYEQLSNHANKRIKNTKKKKKKKKKVLCVDTTDTDDKCQFWLTSNVGITVLLGLSHARDQGAVSLSILLGVSGGALDNGTSLEDAGLLGVLLRKGTFGQSRLVQDALLLECFGNGGDHDEFIKPRSNLLDNRNRTQKWDESHVLCVDTTASH